MTDWPLDQVFDFNGHPVRYAIRGDGPPLVFVHGTPFSSYVWHRIAPYFTATHRVHYFDLLGYGQSAQPDADVSLGREAGGLYPTIRCPVQILWGEDDQWIPIERGPALQHLIPGAQFYPIPNAGHLVQEDAPEAVIAALMRFLPLQQTSR